MKQIDKIVNNAEVSEKAIERYLVDEVKKIGGLCLKYTGTNMVGFPDRVILLPDGATIWVELKSKGKKPNQVQAIRIDTMKKLGHCVYVCDSKDEVNRILYNYKNK